MNRKLLFKANNSSLKYCFCLKNEKIQRSFHECAKLRGLRGSRGLEKLRGSWVVVRGTWVTLRGSWVNLRGSWVLFTDNFA